MSLRKEPSITAPNLEILEDELRELRRVFKTAPPQLMYDNDEGLLLLTQGSQLYT